MAERFTYKFEKLLSRFKKEAGLEEEFVLDKLLQLDLINPDLTPTTKAYTEKLATQKTFQKNALEDKTLYLWSNKIYYQITGNSIPEPFPPPEKRARQIIQYMMMEAANKKLVNFSDYDNINYIKPSTNNWYGNFKKKINNFKKHEDYLQILHLIHDYFHKHPDLPVKIKEVYPNPDLNSSEGSFERTLIVQDVPITQKSTFKPKL